jgi:hypothetical protein
MIVRTANPKTERIQLFRLDSFFSSKMMEDNDKAFFSLFVNRPNEVDVGCGWAHLQKKSKVSIVVFCPVVNLLKLLYSSLTQVQDRPVACIIKLLRLSFDDRK